MLIKEYRIPLPMSVDEYRIAQLYMIQKKSRLESVGEGSGVEILENRPYMNKDGGSGQFTKKIYHIGSHLPGWLKAILPKSALRVEEEAWNAYPYTKMRTTCPFVEKFFVDVETHYLPDAGQTANVFNLTPAELNSREVDFIDPISEVVASGDYLAEEDPLIYQSKKTGRGPMKADWLEAYQTDNPPTPVMCAYKLIKVEFRYWGMQSKIEHFIHSGLRRPMLMGHRQAWVWQDEWYGLTMGDIRRLEEETKAILSQTMGKTPDNLQLECLSDRESDHEGFASNKPRGSVVHIPPLNFSSGENHEDSRLEMISNSENDDSIPSPQSPVAITVERFDFQREQTPLVSIERDQDYARAQDYTRAQVKRDSASFSRDSFPRSMRPYERKGSCSSFDSVSGMLPAHLARRLSKTDVLKGWQMSSIETADSETEDEFFDAREDLESPVDNEPMGSNLLTIQNVELSNSFKSLELDSDSSHGSHESLESVGSSVIEQGRPLQLPPRKEKLCKKVSDTSISSMSACKITTLLLVVHGGSQLDWGQDNQSKHVDCELLKESFQAVINAHYKGAVGRIAIRLVACPSICSKALNMLSQLCPYSETDSDTASCNSGFSPISSSFPISAIPLMVSSSPVYDDIVSAMIAATNVVYQEFLRSDEGHGFSGEVNLLGDCMGTLLAYDALCGTFFRDRSSFSSNHSSNSLNGEHEQTLNASPRLERKPRRISAHAPPNKTNLEASRNLRLSLSSGNIRENVEKLREEIMENNPREGPPISPRLLKEHDNKHSFDAMSLSLDSIPDRDSTFDFPVSKFFAFGSPIGLVLAYRKFIQGDEEKAAPPRPSCNQFYNLFHPFDPSASRIEPLILPQFSHIIPVNVPRYHKFPLGDGQSHQLHNVLGAHPELFLTQLSPRLTPRDVGNISRPGIKRHDSNMSTTSICSTDSIDSMRPQYDGPDCGVSAWWGTKRLDYALYCPEGLQQFPTAVLSPLFHVSYWESSDVAAFVVRQILHGEWDIASAASPSKRGLTFCPSQPREKWLKRRTAIKIKVDIYIMVQPPSGEYVLYDTVVTSSGGRLSYTLSDDKRLPVGIYPVKMVVRGDHTWVDNNLAVVPPKTEAVVFSIDGSFTASVSIRGKDPKVRPGAVDVVRHWQELGFLIVYVTSRPDFQKYKVMSWLAEHNFPYGLVAFGDGITKDLQRHKTEFLKNLSKEAHIVIHSAYGAVKDIGVYASIGLKPNQIYCVGKHHTRKYEKQAQFLKEGYAAHLTALSSSSRAAIGNSRLILRRGCFGLPTRSTRSKHKLLKRTHSDKSQRQKERSSEPDGPAISGTFNYSSFRHTKGRSSAKID
ncbi:protein retinal degeneration B isoform X2 [Nematostella vectensis]|uniref:protein retinal degeneration B isoform X2 n=1 Tax=Nematostella vectensis TaxID=45351 RepID=UPI002076F272|nr:protein retinal degeneration B isoform X2 [Nematostella vectensis]